MANIVFPLGRSARAYYNATKKVGDTGVETAISWLADTGTVEANSMRNVALALASNLVDTNTREACRFGFESQTPVLKGASVTFDTPWDLSDAFINTILASWEVDPQTQVGMAFLNRSKTPGDLQSGDIVNGIVGNFYISLTKDENADDVQRGNFTVTHATEGTWYSATTV